MAKTDKKKPAPAVPAVSPKSPVGPPSFDPFNVSPDLDPALTAHQTDSINKKAGHREFW